MGLRYLTLLFRLILNFLPKSSSFPLSYFSFTPKQCRKLQFFSCPRTELSLKLLVSASLARGNAQIKIKIKITLLNNSVQNHTRFTAAVDSQSTLGSPPVLHFPINSPNIVFFSFCTQTLSYWDPNVRRHGSRAAPASFRPESCSACGAGGTAEAAAAAHPIKSNRTTLYNTIKKHTHTHTLDRRIRHELYDQILLF